MITMHLQEEFTGWHINITQYREKIYDILVQMHELLPSLHPANRVYVDEYLNGYSVQNIEGILRSTKSVTDGQHNSQITELAQFYADAQESALRTNLKEVSYVISSVADATLVAGPARAESVRSSSTVSERLHFMKFGILIVDLSPAIPFV
jgi:hypothetical protein